LERWKLREKWYGNNLKRRSNLRRKLKMDEEGGWWNPLALRTRYLRGGGEI